MFNVRMSAFLRNEVHDFSRRISFVSLASLKTFESIIPECPIPTQFKGGKRKENCQGSTACADFLCQHLVDILKESHASVCYFVSFHSSTLRPKSWSAAGPAVLLGGGGWRLLLEGNLVAPPPQAPGDVVRPVVRQEHQAETGHRQDDPRQFHAFKHHIVEVNVHHFK